MPHKRKSESAAGRKARGRQRYEQRQQEGWTDAATASNNIGKVDEPRRDERDWALPDWPVWLRSDVANATAAASTDPTAHGSAEPASSGERGAGDGSSASGLLADSGSHSSTAK